MGSLLLTLAIVIIVLAVGGAVFLSNYAKRRAKAEEIVKETTESTVAFSWRHILLPLVVLLLTVIIVIALGGQLPLQVAYRFNPDGSPDAFVARTGFLVIILACQFLLTLMAGGITFGIAMLKVPLGGGAGLSSPEKVVSFMGNVIGVPQFILFFVTLDIFSYNLYQIHVFPMWLFLIVVLGLATIALVVTFFYLISRARQMAKAESEQANKKDSK